MIPGTFDFKRGPIIEVEWLDSAGGHNWRNIETDLADPDKYKAMHCRSAGYLIHEDEDTITMGNSLGGTRTVDCTVTILKMCVTTRRELDGAHEGVE